MNQVSHNVGRRIAQAVLMFAISTVLAVTVSGLAWAKAAKTRTAKPQSSASVVTKCKTDLAKRLKIQVSEIKVVESKAVVWPDASLGIPEVGRAYAQVKTPGFRFMLKVRNSQYLYTASVKAYRYGGPVSTWYCSMLYTMPVEHEANLNGDLYQCSLLGTNSIRLVSGVTDYYPQENGIVIFTRRTSRSGFDLLRLQADKPTEVTTLHSSFAFGAAAVNGAGDRWAAFVRQTVGSGWRLAVGKVGRKGEDVQILPLPKGIESGQIAWSDGNVVILNRDSKQMVSYEISPADAAPQWKKVSAYSFPGMPDLMLNKSESLAVDQVEKDGRPCVEVACVWFTGDRNEVALIRDFTLVGYDLLGRYAIMWGKKDSGLAVYTADIATDEVIPAVVPQSARDPKPFRYPPHYGAGLFPTAR